MEIGLPFAGVAARCVDTFRLRSRLNHNQNATAAASMTADW